MERLSELTQRIATLPKGTAFLRYAIALACSEGESSKSVAVAETRWPGMRHLGTVVRNSKTVNYMLHKAAVDPATTTDPDWAAPLAAYETIASEFVEALRPATIIGKIDGAVPAPTFINIPRVVMGSTSSWVGENSAIPVSRQSLDTLALGPMKIASINVLSRELLEDSRPAAEELIRRDLISTIAAYSDAQFIDPTVSATSVNPASITSGATSTPSTGGSVAQITSDVQAMFADGIAAGHSYAAGVWVMHPRTALYLSSVLTAGNSRMWPEINIRGGQWFGLPVITSASVPMDTGNDTIIVLLDASELLVADGAIVVDIAHQAALQLDSAPSDSAASMISLWQKNLAALKVTRHINYRRRRDTAVAVLSGVGY